MSLKNRLSRLFSIIVAGAVLTTLWGISMRVPIIFHPYDYAVAGVGLLVGVIGFVALIIMISPPLPPYLRQEHPTYRFPTFYMEMLVSIGTLWFGAKLISMIGREFDTIVWLRSLWPGIFSLLATLGILRYKTVYNANARLLRRPGKTQAVTDLHQVRHILGFGSAELEVVPEVIHFGDIKCDLGDGLRQAWGIEHIHLIGAQFKRIDEREIPEILHPVAQMEEDLLTWLREKITALPSELAAGDFFSKPNEILVVSGSPETYITGNIKFAFIGVSGVTTRAL